MADTKDLMAASARGRARRAGTPSNYLRFVAPICQSLDYRGGANSLLPDRLMTLIERGDAYVVLPAAQERLRSWR